MAATLGSQRLRRLVAVLAIAGPIACGGESGDGTTAGAGGVAAPSVNGPITGVPLGGTSATAAGSVATSTAGGAALPGMNTTAGASGATSTAGGSAPAAGAMAAGSPAAGNPGTAGSAGSGTMPVPTEKFSFFVASYVAMQRLAKSPDGFGGDLRYGEKDGLSGADKICTEIAEGSMPGAGRKGWRAFLSVTKGPDGNPVHAIDRVGTGPWYDRRGRLIAMTKTDLNNTRPVGADPTILNDLPNEDGVPNHAPDGELVDNHDILTGTNDKGQLFSTDWGFTCHDWTSAVGRDGTPRVGHSWPRTGGPGGFPMGGSGGFGMWPTGGGGTGGFRPPAGIGDTRNWMSALNEAGCAPGASLVEMGPPNPNIPTVGSGGGYGGIYCFALMP